MILTPEDIARIESSRPDVEVTRFWEPTPYQIRVLHRTEKEIGLFGGKFSGKSETARMFLIKGNPHLPDYDKDGNLLPINQSYINHPMYRATILRKNQIDLDEFLSKAAHRYKPMGGRFANGEFKFPSGATIACGHLADRDAWHKYIGIENIRFVIEEAALIGDLNLIDQVLSCCRSVYPEMSAQVLFTSNFGGPGSGWIIDRFIEAKDDKGNPIPPNTTITKLYEDPLHPGEFLPHTRVWMPSTMLDNPYAEKDQSYRASLSAISDEKLRRAYILGDWTAFQGTYFDIFRPKGPALGEPPEARHTIPANSPQACSLKPWWPVVGSLDIGFAHESAFYLYRLTPGHQHHVFHEKVVSQTQYVQLGYEIGMTCRPLLEKLPSHTIPIHISPDALQRRGSDKDARCIAELLAIGISRVLGSDLIHIPDILIRDLRESADDANHPEVKATIEKIRSLRRSGLVFLSAMDDRVPGWQLCRESLRWTQIGNPPPPYDPILSQRLANLSLDRWQEYEDLYRNYTPEILPKLIIHSPLLDSNGKEVAGTGCPRLIQAIPKARHYDASQPNKNPEDVDKTHFLGMDSLDSWRYGEMGIRDGRFVEPFDELRERTIASLEAANPNILMIDKVLANVSMEEREAKRGDGRPVIIPRKGRASRYRPYLESLKHHEEDQGSSSNPPGSLFDLFNRR